MRYGVSALIVFIVICLQVTAAHALQMPSKGSSKYASDQEVKEAVGDLSFRITCPSVREVPAPTGFRNPKFDAERGAQIMLSKPGFGHRDDRVKLSILRQGIYKIWEDCPLYTISSRGESREYRDIEWISFYGRPSEDSPAMVLWYIENYEPSFAQWSGPGQDVGRIRVFRPLYEKSGFVSDAELAAQVGTITFQMIECVEGNEYFLKRTVVALLQKPNFESGPIINTIAEKARVYALQACPMPIQFGKIPQQISGVRIAYNGEVLFTIGKLNEVVTNSPKYDVYEWGRASNVAASKREQAVDDAASSRFWGTVGTIFNLIVLAVLAYIAYRLYEPALRLFYSLTPHPAAGMLHGAMQSNAPLDGAAFRRALDAAGGGRIEMEVRRAQAMKLSDLARSHAERLRAQAERVKAEAIRQEEFLQAQESLAQAALAHERAKARLDAMTEQTKR